MSAPWRDWLWTYNPRPQQCNESSHKGFEVVAWDPVNLGPHNCKVVAIFRDEEDAQRSIAWHEAVPVDAEQGVLV